MGPRPARRVDKEGSSRGLMVQDVLEREREISVTGARRR